MENLWQRIFLFSNDILEVVGNRIASILVPGHGFQESNIYDEVEAIELRDPKNGNLYIVSKTNENGCFLFEVRGVKPLGDYKKQQSQIDAELGLINSISSKLEAIGIRSEKYE